MCRSPGGANEGLTMAAMFFWNQANWEPLARKFSALRRSTSNQPSSLERRSLLPRNYGR